MVRLDAMLKAMNKDGTLREFNRQLRRAAAAVEGRGFMTYAVAMARLKAALVPMLMSGVGQADGVDVRGGVSVKGAGRVHKTGNAADASGVNCQLPSEAIQWLTFRSFR